MCEARSLGTMLGQVIQKKIVSLEAKKSHY